MKQFTCSIIIFLAAFCWTPSLSLKERATGIDFASTLDKRPLFGVGVRKKGPISVYAVGMYGPAAIKEQMSTVSRKAKDQALKILREAVPNLATTPASTSVDTATSGASTSDASESSDTNTAFLLVMSFKVGAEKISAAIAESVAARYTTGDDHVQSLKALIFNGVTKKGGSATKGTTFFFDCSTTGIQVAVDGTVQGKVQSPGLSRAFCQVYLDEKCVSPALLKSCIEECCGP
jgi:hypothetical protein